MNRVEQRDRDIAIINRVNTQLSRNDDLSFVVSGSYAIEALTQTRIEHNDIDANVFANDVQAAMVNIQTLLDYEHVSDMDFILYKTTAERIEYDIPQPRDSSDGCNSRLEIHIMKATMKDKNTIVMGGINDQSVFRVDLVETEVIDSNGNAYTFKVKSLPYSIATWVIRISGLANNPRRCVKNRDMEGLRLLLQQKYSLQDVVVAMRNHPQMPEGKTEDEIFRQALKVISLKGE